MSNIIGMISRNLYDGASRTTQAQRNLTAFAKSRFGLRQGEGFVVCRCPFFGNTVNQPGAVSHTPATESCLPSGTGVRVGRHRTNTQGKRRSAVAYTLVTSTRVYRPVGKIQGSMTTPNCGAGLPTICPGKGLSSPAQHHVLLVIAQTVMDEAVTVLDEAQKIRARAQIQVTASRRLLERSRQCIAP